MNLVTGFYCLAKEIRCGINQTKAAFGKVRKECHMEYKKCTVCNAIFPETIVYFHKKKGGKNGLASLCKECGRVNSKKQYIQNQEKRKLARRIYVKNNTDLVKESKRQYYERNKERISQQKKKYCEENKDYVKQLKADSYRRNIKHTKLYLSENREQQKLYTKRYYKENMQREKLRTKLYRINNREYFRNYEQKRRSIKNSLLCTLTSDEWENTIEYFENSCCYCGKKAPLEQEHFIPLTKRGGYTSDNIIPACKSCNSSKNNSDFFEWYPRQEFYNTERENKIISYINDSVKIQIS